MSVAIDPASVRVSVRDGQAATDAFRRLIAAPVLPVPATSHRGRGLALVKSLATSVGLIDFDDGKAMWFEVERTTRSAR